MQATSTVFFQNSLPIDLNKRCLGEMLYVSPMNNRIECGASAIGESLTLRDQGIVYI